jgi:hypothetical protein
MSSSETPPVETFTEQLKFKTKQAHANLKNEITKSSDKFMNKLGLTNILSRPEHLMEYCSKISANKGLTTCDIFNVNSSGDWLMVANSPNTDAYSTTNPECSSLTLREYNNKVRTKTCEMVVDKLEQMKQLGVKLPRINKNCKENAPQNFVSLDWS